MSSYYYYNWILLQFLLLSIKYTSAQSGNYCTTKEFSNSSLPQCSSLESLTNEARYEQANEPRKDARVPSWINITMARQGQKFANEYLSGVLMSHLCGLASSLCYDDAVKIMLFTEQSKTPQQAMMRYIATIAQVIIWYEDKTFSDGSDIFASLSKVHELHSGAQNAAKEYFAQNGGSLVNNSVYADYELTTALKYEFFKDLENSQIPPNQRLNPPANCIDSEIVPFNQQIQALTQFAFVGTIVLYPERLGIFASLDDIWAFNHLWAVIGYSLGLNDKYNLALQPDLQTQRNLYRKIFEKYALPIQFNMKHQEKALLENTFKGIEKINMLTPNVAFYMCATHIYQIAAPLTYSVMTADERAMVEAFNVTHIPAFTKDPVTRAANNRMVKNLVYKSGVASYGHNFATRKSRARNCYYAKY